MNPSIDNNLTVTDVRDTSVVTPTGDNRLDGMLPSEKYSLDPGQGIVTSLTFSFATSESTLPLSKDSQLGSELLDINFKNYGPIHEQLRDEAMRGLQQLEKFTNLDFHIVEDKGERAGTIRIGTASLDGEGIGGMGFFPEKDPIAGTVIIVEGELSPTAVDYKTNVIHEIGHALGLEHPEEAGQRGATEIPAQFLGHEYSVMSQMGDGSISAKIAGADNADLFPTTYMYLDILTLQALYGVNETATAGTDIYVVDLSQRHYKTIWDYGGIDTLVLENGNVDVRVDLTPGSWIDVGTTITYTKDSGEIVGTDKETIYITPETTIENLVSAGGNDILIGNAADNQIWGSAGDDSIDGRTGNDTLGGSVGDDTLSGGAGDDVLFASAGNDSVEGGVGNDILFNGEGIDTVNGGAGNDTLYGGPGDDVLFGGEGKDTFMFFLGGGNDRIEDFDVSDDLLDLSGVGANFANVQQVERASTAQSGGVLIVTSEDSSVFLTGLALADISQIQIVLD